MQFSLQFCNGCNACAGYDFSSLPSCVPDNKTPLLRISDSRYIAAGYVHRYRCEKANKKSPANARLFVESGSVLLSRAVSSQVPSALKGLTSVFGMGTGGSLLLSPPECCEGFAQPLSAWFPVMSFYNHDLSVPGEPPRIALLSFYPARTLKTAHPAFLHLAPVTFSWSLDQVLDRLVSSSSKHYCSSTDDLST